MCGIAGILSYRDDAPPVDQGELLRIREHMRNRGPDGAGLWISPDQRVGLAHRRLSIIDLSEAGAQPMLDPITGNQIVFNGEIYNYKELRAGLERAGHQFRSTSDTEVLLKLYQQHGAEMLPKLRGMFAFAVWDQRKQSVFLVRDPLGIKPLYYADNGKTLRFASQVKALRAGGQIDSGPEAAGHVGFYLWGSVPDPYTLYAGIRALPAGHCMTISSRGIEAPRPFHQLQDIFSSALDNPATGTREDALHAISEAVRDSVHSHQVADVPVGTFLSAGLDSALITSLSKTSNIELKTLTLAFKEFAGTREDEAPLAEFLAGYLGTKHTTVHISQQEFEQQRQQLLDAMDQPSIDGVNTWFVASVAAQQGMKVALSGVGGDELFATYPSFINAPRIARGMAIFSQVPAIARWLRKLSLPVVQRFTSPKYAGLFEYGGNLGSAYFLTRALHLHWELSSLLDPAMAAEGWERLQLLPKMQGLTATLTGSQRDESAGPARAARERLAISQLEMSCYMRHQLLRDTDWAGMAHSLEIRTPLADIQLLKTIAPWLARYPDISKKQVVEKCVPDLPNRVLNRHKSGFSTPVSQWLREDQTPHTRSLTNWAREVYRYQRAEIKDNSSPATAGSPLAPARAIRSGLLAPEIASKGGVQSFMQRLVEVLDSEVNDPRAQHAVCMSLNDRTSDLEHIFTQTRHVKVWGAKRSKLRLVLYTLLSMPRIDVLLVGHIGLGPLAYFLKKLGRVKRYYVILHGIEAWCKADYFDRLALQDAAKCIATTKYTASECALHNKMSLDSFQVIPLCTADRQIEPDPTFRLQGDFKLLCVARLDASERYKGIEHIFRAVHELKHSHPEIHFNLVGKGNDQLRLQNMVRELGIESLVTFWGALSDESLAAAYCDCDLFVMPSKKEGFGIVFLEAMRYGKPCIGGNHGGTPEVIEHKKSGYLVEYGDAYRIEEYIRQMMQNTSLRESMGARGRELVTTQFGFVAFRQQYQQLVTVG